MKWLTPPPHHLSLHVSFQPCCGRLLFSALIFLSGRRWCMCQPPGSLVWGSSASPRDESKWSITEREWRRLWLPEQHSSPVIYRMSPKDIKLISHGLLCVFLNICGLLRQGVWMAAPWWGRSRERGGWHTDGMWRVSRWAPGARRSAAQGIFWDDEPPAAPRKGGWALHFVYRRLQWVGIKKIRFS